MKNLCLILIHYNIILIIIYRYIINEILKKESQSKLVLLKNFLRMPSIKELFFIIKKYYYRIIVLNY